MTSSNRREQQRRRRYKNEPGGGVLASATADSLLRARSSARWRLAAATTTATDTNNSATAATRPHAHSLLASHCCLLLRSSHEAQLRLAVRRACTPTASRSRLATTSFAVRCCLHPAACATNCSCSRQIRWRVRSSTTATAAAALGMCAMHNSHSAPPITTACASCTSVRASASAACAHSAVSASAATVVSIMPRMTESIVLVLPATVVPTRPSKLALLPSPSTAAHAATRRWHIVYDVVAQMVVLPVVCVSVCSAVGLLLGLECIEKLPQLRAPWRSIGSVIVRVWARSAAPLVSSSPSSTSLMGATPIATISHHANGPWRLHQHQYATFSSSSEQPHDNEPNDDDNTARRPLKKQRSHDDRTSDCCVAPTTSAVGTSTSVTTRSTQPLDAAPLVRKTRVQPPMLPAVARKRRVFIWDLDETLVLFASLYTGAFAQSHGKEIAAGVQLGEQMMAFMLTMLERHFFFDDLHDADIDHITSVGLDTTAGPVTPAGPSAAVAERYARIRAIYERAGGAVDFLTDAHSEWFAIREALVAGIDAFSTGWLREARRVLELLTGSVTSSTSSSFENVNLLVTNTQLAPALCKVLIYQLDAFFPIESVYSSAKVHKQHCFERILSTFAGDDVEFVAVGDGAEEEHVSRLLGIRFHKIRTLADLQRLRVDLELEAVAGAQ